MGINNSLYYDGSKDFKIVPNSKYHTLITKGMRGRGKTTFWIATAAERSVLSCISGENNHKFIFLRRSEDQMREVIAKGMFNGVLTVPKYREMLQGFTHEKIVNKYILLQNDNEAEICVGYIHNLNNTKGISIENTDLIIFDEFVEPTRDKYKGGDSGIHEPELLARLDETINRLRENWLILLGNFDSPTDPYVEYFGVPYGVNKWSDRKRGILYEVDVSEASKEMKLSTSTGERWAGTQYSKYSNGDFALGSVDSDLICNKPPHAVHEFNINVAGTKLTCWIDENTKVCYFHDNYKFDTNKPIYTALSKDMQINTLFVGYNRDLLTLLRIRYGQGRVRFNNQKSAALFSLLVLLSR